MDMQRTADGPAIRLRSHGWGRFGAAAFLAFWLCGWAAGECFALWVLGTGLSALISGDSTALGTSAPGLGPALAVGAFLLVWLTFWTIGGVAAIAELLRLLWGEDRITASEGRLRIVRFRGPFRSTREYPRETILRILLAPHNGALALDTARERIEVSGLGRPGERSEAVRTLRGALGVSEGAGTASIALPKGWQESITPEGERALVPDMATRRTQSRVLAAATFLVSGMAMLLFRETWLSPGLLPFTILAALAAATLGCGAAWLGRGRMEWRFGGGHLRLFRRFGTNAREIFEGERLEIVSASDSDGDHWYTLEAVRGKGDVTHHALSPKAERAKRRKIVSAMNDAALPARLGEWLARAAGVPLEDRTTKEAREKEVAALRDQLAASGRAGRFALRLLDSVQRGRERQG